MKGVCSVCSTPTKLGCEDCGVVRYCSKRCQKGDHEKHSIICALIAGKDDLVFLFSDAFNTKTILAVLATLTDEQIYARMPPARAYYALNTNVKRVCIHLDFRWFWKQRVQVLNPWAYNRVKPADGDIFEFWWSLCRGMEALMADNRRNYQRTNYKLQKNEDTDFIIALLDRMGEEYRVTPTNWPEFNPQYRYTQYLYMYPFEPEADGFAKIVSVGGDRGASRRVDVRVATFQEALHIASKLWCAVGLGLGQYEGSRYDMFLAGVGKQLRILKLD
jgi:hypothetical protein